MPVLITAFCVAMATLLSFGATALAAGAVATEDSGLLELLQPVVEAFRGGQHTYAACLTLVLLVAVARRWGAKRWDFLGTDAGGTLLTFLGAFGAAMAASLAAGAGPSLSMAWTAFGVAAGASGGYTILKRLLVDPVLAPLVAKLPPWAQVPLRVLLAIFGSSPRVKKAEAAGAAAVEAKPAEGISAVKMERRDVD